MSARTIAAVDARALAIHGVVRYEPILRLVRELEGGRLLEVGSAHAGIRGYGLTDPGWDVTVVDRSFENYGQAVGAAPPRDVRVVVGDARALPFADRSFEVTVALDLLEHVPAADRVTVLGELARVTSRRLIVGCPAGAAARNADRRLAEGFRRSGRAVPDWLAEHLELGLPEPAELESEVGRLGRVRLLGNESVAAHLRLMRVHARLGWTPPFRLAVAAFVAGCARDSRVCSRLLWLVRGRDRPPVYRTIAVLETR